MHCDVKNQSIEKAVISGCNEDKLRSSIPHATGVSTQTGSKGLPAEMVALLDVAVFSFASLSSLRSTHKTW